MCISPDFLGASAYFTRELVVGHGDLDVLDDGALDVLDGLLATVVDVDGSVDLLAMVVELLVESHLHVELSGGQSEALGHEGAGLALVAGHGRELHLPDGEGDGVALVGLLIGIVAHEHAQFVNNAEGLALRKNEVRQYGFMDIYQGTT